MMTKLQFKMLSRKIKANFGRFIAIILIIMLGVMLFVGIRSSGPDLYSNADLYLNDQKTSDIQISSPLGLTETDLELAKTIKGAKVEATKADFALTKKNNHVLELLSFKPEMKLNKPKIIAGRFPKNHQEILLDEQAKLKGFKLNQTITLKETNLKNKKFKVVGFVTSPLMINKHTRPVTNIGDGAVDYFAYVANDNFPGNTFANISLRFENLSQLNSFKDNYQIKVDDKLSGLKKIFKTRQITRLNEIEKPLINQKNQLQAALNQLKQLPLIAQDTSAIKAQKTELESNLKKIDGAVANIKKVGTNYSFSTRKDLAGFASFGELADRITVIANVFPMFFFLIAILITFTTMTRMVEEERTQIGTLKALGYSSRQIEQNYFWYALLAAIFGSILGIVIGISTLPRIVMQMMSMQYVFTSSRVTFEWLTIIIAIGLALFATIGAVLIVTSRELRHKPSVLMLPKTPKAGKRILLERITPIWQRLSFFRKVSYRNLFRFKSRMWMGIIGIAGGAGLILTGFGIRDSIAQAGQRQFGQIMNYQAIVTLMPDSKTTAAEKILSENKQFKASLPVESKTFKAKADNKTIDSITVMATDNVKDLQKFVKLTDSRLTDSGAIISQKLAKLMNLKVGSSLKLTDSDNHQIKVKVSGITENYVAHFVYLNAHYFNNLFKEKFSPNSWLVQTNKMSKNQEQNLAADLLATKQVVNVSYLSDQLESVNNQVENLSPIIIVFIFLSGLLTFVVLYNLTNVNISERIRELSTIKVLGFYNCEVSMYVVRENIVLTIFGIVFGIVFGNGLLWFILQQAMTDQVIFPLSISLTGYITAVVLTIIFTGIVAVVTHHKLKTIDMIDALKANE